jgi:hypothetical protein
MSCRAGSGSTTTLIYNGSILKKDSDAEASWRKAQELEPGNYDYFYSLADFP